MLLMRGAASIRRSYWCTTGTTTMTRPAGVSLPVLRGAVPGPVVCRRARAFSAAPAPAPPERPPPFPFWNDHFALQGRCAMITGGGSGIGAALATGLARAGATVVLVGRRQRALDDTCNAIIDQLQLDGCEPTDAETHVHACPGDITDFDSLPSLVKDAAYRAGIPPTILINNAGANARKPIDALHSDDFAESFNLMLTAPFLLSRAMAPHMQSQQHGRILNVASLQAFQAFPNSIPYATAKSGVLGLTRALAEAYAPCHGYSNVTVNAIAPGYVETELTAKVFADPDRAKRLADQTVLGRNSVPSDLVGAAIFLVGPSSSYITGQTLIVDGGFTALGLR